MVNVLLTPEFVYAVRKGIQRKRKNVEEFCSYKRSGGCLTLLALTSERERERKGKLAVVIMMWWWY